MKTVLDTAISNLSWPSRGADSVAVYQKQMSLLTSDQEVLHSPLLVAWDDWNLEKSDWEGSAPFFFYSERAKEVYSLTSLAVSAARKACLISPDDKGLSYFLYRNLKLKKIIRLAKASPEESPSATANGDEIIIRVRPLPTPLFSSFENPPQIKDSIPRGDFQSSISDWINKNSAKAVTELKAVECQIKELLSPFVSDASKIFGFSSGEVVDGKATLDALITTILFYSFEFEELKEVVYIPSRGFLRFDSGEVDVEECSGGVYVWSSNYTICNARSIQAFDSYRGLRTSIYDWERRRTNELRHALRRSARAAVFARNFSHITGSHVISNPEFRHSLVGGGVMRVMRTQMENFYHDFTRAENDLFRFAVEEGRDMEMLWREGTKVLDSARQHLRTGGALLENTRRFHQYLQGRFDFIARAIDDSQDQPEPLWFVKDLVEGFLSQTAHLDALVADVGLRREDMEFVVKLPVREGRSGSASFQADWKPDPRSGALIVDWKALGSTTGKIEDHATLVALPGGMVSAHAFYSLLENIIRNSAKYGSLKEIQQKAEKPYRLTMELSRAFGKDGNPQNHFDLRIWDNFSGATRHGATVDKQPWKMLQKRLEQDFVKPTGEQATENLGMMEMQACAKMLYRGEAKGVYPGDRPDHVCSDAYASGMRTRKPEEFNLWTEEVKTPAREEIDPFLTYHLTLNVPVLLAALTQRSGKGAFSYRAQELEEVRKNRPHLLVLDGAADDDTDQWLNEIAIAPEAVPYRTFVLCPVDCKECADRWKEKLGSLGIPERRVRVLPDVGGLYDRVFPAELSSDNEKDAILAAYEAWLRAFKGDPKDGQWHLWIGMERPMEQVKEGWETGVTRFNRDHSLIRLRVRSFAEGRRHDLLGGDGEGKPINDDDAKESYWKEERAAAANDKRALVFDNHGNCFPGAYEAEKETDLKQGTRFYQKLSGTTSPDLFRALSRPPTDPFGFAFFVFSLVESCLTNVAVVDERLAWNLVEGASGGARNERFAENLAEHQKAGVFPVFRFRQAKSGADVGFYNATHRKLLEECVANKNVLTEEGVTFNADTRDDSKICLLMTRKKDKAVAFESIAPEVGHPYAPDVLLIHEGAMDILTSEQGVEWKTAENGKGANQTYLDALYSLVPAIVRTSGRGRQSKLLGGHLPFIEFGEVSSSLLTARNKLSLVRGLLGSAGTRKEP